MATEQEKLIREVDKEFEEVKKQCRELGLEMAIINSKGAFQPTFQVITSLDPPKLLLNKLPNGTTPTSNYVSTWLVQAEKKKAQIEQSSLSVFRVVSKAYSRESRRPLGFVYGTAFKLFGASTDQHSMIFLTARHNVTTSYALTTKVFLVPVATPPPNNPKPIGVVCEPLGENHVLHNNPQIDTILNEKFIAQNDFIFLGIRKDSQPGDQGVFNKILMSPGLKLVANPATCMEHSLCLLGWPADTSVAAAFQQASSQAPEQLIPPVKVDDKFLSELFYSASILTACPLEVVRSNTNSNGGVVHLASLCPGFSGAPIISLQDGHEGEVVAMHISGVPEESVEHQDLQNPGQPKKFSAVERNHNRALSVDVMRSVVDEFVRFA